MTGGHIVTIVQNLIAGHGSLPRTAGLAPVIKSVRFVSCLVPLRICGRGHGLDSKGLPARLYLLNNTIARKGTYLGTGRKTQKRKEKQEKCHPEGGAEAFFR
jgi:hypothetical protein